MTNSMLILKSFDWEWHPSLLLNILLTEASPMAMPNSKEAGKNDLSIYLEEEKVFVNSQ